MPREISPPIGKGIKRTVSRSRSNPLMLTLSADSQILQNVYSKQPHLTKYSEYIATELKGAADFPDLDKIDPMTEKQLLSIYPRATAVLMKDPLTQTDKTILHDNIRREGNTRRALQFLAHFILGKEAKPTLDVNRKFATEERKQAELDAIMRNEDYLMILESIMDRDEQVDIHAREVELLISGHGYGRSILVKQYDTKGYPVRLIPFSSTRLGRVYVDKKTHEFLGVEYLDYPTNARILPAKDIIHYEVDDYLVSPNSRYYGMPVGESSMYLAQANRQANEIAKPEIMARMYAPIMLVKVFTKSEEKLTEIESKWRAGKTIYYNDDVEVQVVAIPHDLTKLTETVVENAKQIYRDATIPLVVAFQEEQNRATAETSMIQWYEGTLQFKRTHLNAVMWRQWYKPQLEKIMEERDVNRISEVGGVYNYLVNQATKGQDLPFKITLEFNNISTSGLLDKAAGVLQSFDRRLLSNDIARTELGWAKYNSDMRLQDKAAVVMGQRTQLANATNNLFSKQQTMQNGAEQMQQQPPGTEAITSGFGSLGKGLPTRSPK